MNQLSLLPEPPARRVKRERAVTPDATQFARSHARTSDPSTSHDAAARAEKFAKSQSGRILACLLTFGPMSKDQIATQLNLTGVQVSRRLPDLNRDGLAYPTDLTNKSASGCAERIWAAT